MIEHTIDGPSCIFESNRCFLGDLIEVAEKEFLPSNVPVPFDFIKVGGCFSKGIRKMLLYWSSSLYHDNIYRLPIDPCITLSYLISEAKRISDNYKKAEITFWVESDKIIEGVYFNRFFLKAG
jgi:hypothetical protein